MNRYVRLFKARNTQYDARHMSLYLPKGIGHTLQDEPDVSSGLWVTMVCQCGWKVMFAVRAKRRRGGQHCALCSTLLQTQNCFIEIELPKMLRVLHESMQINGLKDIRLLSC